MGAVIFGDRLRSARVLRALTATVVADWAGWSAATQSRLEKTVSFQLEADGAERLSTVLRFPLAYLSAPPPPPLCAEQLLFRAPARTTQREKDYLAEFARLIGELVDWLDDKHRLPPVKLPVRDSRTDLTLAASEVRRSFGLGPDQPIGHLTHHAERAGVLVVLRDLGSGRDGPLRSTDEAPDKEIVRAALHEDHHGYSTRTGEAHDRPMIVHRAVSSWERTRLTVAHEIGHLVLHSRELLPDAEEVAYDFAAELLAPAVAVAQHLPWPVTLAELLPIKMHFGISVAALVKHLRRHELIDKARYQTLTSQLYRRRNPASGTTWRKQEPGWDQRKPEQPRLLRTWLERCLGTAAPQAVHQMSGELWPTDLLASILSGQRDHAAARPSSPTMHEPHAHSSRGDVVD
ncbi:MAG: hypothetical protein QOK27_1703, partial [Gemmatimonadales bacterium]|nr:hypothetical protein [Gemmatimonadales bacterium]